MRSLRQSPRLRLQPPTLHSRPHRRLLRHSLLRLRMRQHPSLLQLRSRRSLLRPRMRRRLHQPLRPRPRQSLPPLRLHLRR